MSEVTTPPPTTQEISRGLHLALGHLAASIALHWQCGVGNDPISKMVQEGYQEINELSKRIDAVRAVEGKS